MTGAILESSEYGPAVRGGAGADTSLSWSWWACASLDSHSRVRPVDPTKQQWKEARHEALVCLGLAEHGTGVFSGEEAQALTSATQEVLWHLARAHVETGRVRRGHLVASAKANLALRALVAEALASGPRGRRLLEELWRRSRSVGIYLRRLWEQEKYR